MNKIVQNKKAIHLGIAKKVRFYIRKVYYFANVKEYELPLHSTNLYYQNCINLSTLFTKNVYKYLKSII